MTALLPAAAALILSLAALSEDPRPGTISADVEEKLKKHIGDAKALYQKKDHRGSADACLQLVAIIPAGAGFDALRMQVHYFAAANLSLLDQVDDAIAQIEKAIESGLTQMAPLEGNPDFAAVRKSKGYKDLPEKMRRRGEQAEKRRLDGLRAFDFSLTTVDGKPVRKADFRGNVLIVDVWGTWCPPCRMEVPHFIELHKRYAGKGLRIVGLNSEKVAPSAAADTVRKFIASSGIPYPCAMAPQELLRTIPGFSSFPTTLFFGRDGTPRAIEVGARGLAELEAIVKPLLDEPAPAPAGEKKAEGK